MLLDIWNKNTYNFDMILFDYEKLINNKDQKKQKNYFLFVIF